MNVSTHTRGRWPLPAHLRGARALDRPTGQQQQSWGRSPGASPKASVGTVPVVVSEALPPWPLSWAHGCLPSPGGSTAARTLPVQGLAGRLGCRRSWGTSSPRHRRSQGPCSLLPLHPTRGPPTAEHGPRSAFRTQLRSAVRYRPTPDPNSAAAWAELVAAGYPLLWDRGPRGCWQRRMLAGPSVSGSPGAAARCLRGPAPGVSGPAANQRRKVGSEATLGTQADHRVQFLRCPWKAAPDAGTIVTSGVRSGLAGPGRGGPERGLPCRARGQGLRDPVTGCQHGPEAVGKGRQPLHGPQHVIGSVSEPQVSRRQARARGSPGGASLPVGLEGRPPGPGEGGGWQQPGAAGEDGEEGGSSVPGVPGGPRGSSTFLCLLSPRLEGTLPGAQGRPAPQTQLRSQRGLRIAQPGQRPLQGTEWAPAWPRVQGGARCPGCGPPGSGRSSEPAPPCRGRGSRDSSLGLPCPGRPWGLAWGHPAGEVEVR